MYRVMVFVAFVSVALSFCGCITYQPEQHKVEREFVVKLNTSEATTRIRRWLTSNGFIIAESTATLISATSNNIDQLQGYSYDAWNGVRYSAPVADCGRRPMGLGSSGGQMSISIEPDRIDSGSGTRVIINFTPGINRSLAITCVSNGVIEKTIKQVLSEKE